jgi:hypothetical protein
MRDDVAISGDQSFDFICSCLSICLQQLLCKLVLFAIEKVVNPAIPEVEQFMQFLWYQNLYLCCLLHDIVVYATRLTKSDQVETFVMTWMLTLMIGFSELPKGHFTHKPRAVTMKFWEPKRKCPNPIPTHLQTHVVWSRILKCSVKSYVTGPSTKCYFNEFLCMHALTHDKIK